MSPEERDLIVSMLAALRLLLRDHNFPQTLQDLDDAFLVMNESVTWDAL